MVDSSVSTLSTLLFQFLLFTNIWNLIRVCEKKKIQSKWKQEVSLSKLLIQPRRNAVLE